MAFKMVKAKKPFIWTKDYKSIPKTPYKFVPLKIYKYKPKNRMYERKLRLRARAWRLSTEFQIYYANRPWARFKRGVRLLGRFFYMAIKAGFSQFEKFLYNGGRASIRFGLWFQLMRFQLWCYNMWQSMCMRLWEFNEWTIDWWETYGDLIYTPKLEIPKKRKRRLSQLYTRYGDIFYYTNYYYYNKTERRDVKCRFGVHVRPKETRKGPEEWMVDDRKWKAWYNYAHKLEYYAALRHELRRVAVKILREELQKRGQDPERIKKHARRIMRMGDRNMRRTPKWKLELLKEVKEKNLQIKQQQKKIADEKKKLRQEARQLREELRKMGPFNKKKKRGPRKEDLFHKAHKRIPRPVWVGMPGVPAWSWKEWKKKNRPDETK